MKKRIALQKHTPLLCLLGIVIGLGTGPLCFGQVIALEEMPIISGYGVKAEMKIKDGRPIGDYSTCMHYGKRKDGSALSIGEVTFQRGIHLSTSKLGWQYNLDGNYLSFFTYVGTPSEQRDNALSGFRIEGDGKVLYNSGVMPPGKVHPVLVDVRGVKELSLILLREVGRGGQVILGEPRLTTWPTGPAERKAPSVGQAGNQIPTVKLALSAEQGRAPLKVAFETDQSVDPDGKIMRYTWFFGDGEKNTLDFNPTHTFEEPGLYGVMVVAEDDKGGQGVGKAVVTVAPPDNQPPMARATVSQGLISPGEEVTFSAEQSTDFDGTIVSYEWTFPDGETRAGRTCTRTFKTMDIYPVQLTVTDNNGASSRTSVRVRVDDGSNTTVFPMRQGSRVLFIGNSLLGGIGNPLDAFAELHDPPFSFEKGGAGKGAGNVQQFAEQPELGVREKINEGWDIVIIQPWGRPYKDDWETVYKPYARTLVEWIRQTGAYPVFLEPHVSYWNLPEQQPLGAERIGGFARELGAGYIPAGQAWLEVYTDYPAPRGGRLDRLYDDETKQDVVDMLYSDNVHQNPTGGFLNALVIWHYLTGQAPDEISMPKQFKDRSLKKINMDLVPYLQKAAARVSVPAEPLRRDGD